MVESEFNFVHYLRSKQRIILNILRCDLLPNHTNLQPHIYGDSEDLDGYYLVFSFVGCIYLGLACVTPFVFFSTPFNSLVSYLSLKAVKELLKEEEIKIPFKSKLYFWV